MKRSLIDKLGHYGMGILSGLLPIMILWVEREQRQLPPENDKYPAIRTQGVEYWAAPRVEDILLDLREIAATQPVGWGIATIGAFFLGRAL